MQLIKSAKVEESKRKTQNVGKETDIIICKSVR